MDAASPVLLVVENDTLVRHTLIDALENRGFAVLGATDAAAALGLLTTRGDIAALLTDVELDDGPDGIALARAARLVQPGLAVLYVSGWPGGVPPGALVAGADFLAKPFTAGLAEALIRRLLAGQGAGAGPAGRALRHDAG